MRSGLVALLAGQSLHFSDADPVGFGLIVFDNPDAELEASVRELSRGGMDRLLAVALNKTDLGTEAIWRLLNAGASDVMAWDSLERPANDIAARFARWRAVDELVALPVVRDNLIGSSPAWTTLLRQVVEVAAFSKAAVLLSGESGTGKELLARVIHTLDRRQQKRDLVIVDCTTIVPELSGSEFFGHERGAYTGSIGVRDGAFSIADEGTLFLDEIGELSLLLQPQLLRVIQEQTYKRVGGNTWQRTNFRLVSATNRKLTDEVEKGAFRADLYHRIAAWTFRVPPLRERAEDIIPLARYFLKEQDPTRPVPELDEPVRDYLIRREYSGNARELRQLVHRIGQRHVGSGPITAGDIPRDELPACDTPTDWRNANFDAAIRRALDLGVPLRDIGRTASEAAIGIALADANGNLQRAARRLRVTDRALQLRRAVRASGASAED